MRLKRGLVAYLGFVALACVLAPQPARGGESPDIFRLQEWLGRHWRNEVVSFDAGPAALQHAKAGHALVGPAGEAVAYQIARRGGESAIEFAADLAAFETRTYRFQPRRADPVTDLRLEETAELVHIGNALIGVSVPKVLKPGAGPIAGVRLASGRWVGGSSLRTPQASGAYSVEIVSRGPVAAEVVCRLRIAGEVRWELRLRVQANEPVVLVDETYALGPGAVFELDLSQGFEPDTLFYRYGRSAPGDANSVGQLASWKIAADSQQPVFMWEPWLHWWERQRQGNWFALYREDHEDMLAVGAREPGVWVDPTQPRAARAQAQIPLRLQGNRLSLPLPLAAGARKWMIGAHDKDASLDRWKRGNRRHAPPPQQYLIKHGDFPLERVRRYVFDWTRGNAEGPRLLVRPGDIGRLRARFRPEPRRLADLAKAPLTQYALDDAIVHYLASGDRALGRHLAATAVRWTQEAVNMFLQQGELVTIGFAPHHQTRILWAINLADAAGAPELLPAELRARLEAQLAFLAYTVNRADYWSPERGFSANPNMTSTVAAFQAALACTIREHPMASSWVANAMRELKNNQLDRWADDNGGWLEAPHYAMVSYDYLLGAFLMTHNAGFNDYLFDPKMKKVIEWLAKISTPPDPEAGGHRAFPPIGNTLVRESSGKFGAVAFLWKERDPVFAAEMQWMHRQHGSPVMPGIGGFFPMLAGYRKVLIDPLLPERVPAYGSEWFPKTGVVLRNEYPGNRETQLHLIAGSNHAHYDRDSGSITIWGKGRIVANDFGYYGEAPAEDHSMVVSPAAADNQLMNVVRFDPGKEIDYLRGTKSDAWDRAIVFLKGRPLDPNYFVMSDVLRRGPPGTWRLWLAASQVELSGDRALARGLHDVDTDVYIVRPRGLPLKTESKSRQSYGMTAGKYGRHPMTQQGLVAPIEKAITSVVYPRLRGEGEPRVTPLADGRGLRVETSRGIDYIFLSEVPLVYSDERIRFQGTVGVARIRAEGPVLWLGEAGSISAGAETITRH